MPIIKENIFAIKKEKEFTLVTQNVIDILKHIQEVTMQEKICTIIQKNIHQVDAI